MKTCKQIEDQINEVKDIIRQICLIDQFDRTDRNKCDSESMLVKCEFCNCYKNRMEIYNVVESKKADNF